MAKKIEFLVVSRPVISLALMFVSGALISAVLVFLLERQNTGLSFPNSVFTATSAITMTGLTVVDTYKLTFASQVMLLVTFQLGGMMTVLGSAFLIKLAGHIGASHHGKMSAASLFGATVGDLGKLLRFTISFVVFVELLAAFLLYLYFRETMPQSEAVWYAAFHSISAFCNAGFFLFEDNMYSFGNEPFVLAVMMAEIVLGGIGFLVLLSIRTRFMAFARGTLKKIWLFRSLKTGKLYGWPLHARLAILAASALLPLGFVVFFGLEYNNSLKGLPLGEQILASAFQSVNGRTAGFSAVDISKTSDATRFFYTLLMFIGGGSVSMAGGIKVTTFAIFMVMIWKYRSREEIALWRRIVSQKTISKANIVFMLSFVTLTSFIFLLLVAERDAELNDIFFEATSAFGTVGLSTGITPSLSFAGKMLIAILMLVGRIGPVALTYIFGRGIISRQYLWLEEEVEVG